MGVTRLTSKAWISLGAGTGVGQIEVDSSQVRAENVAGESRLVIPAIIHLHPRPSNQQLAILYLLASVHLDEVAFSTSQIGPRIRLDPDGIGSWATGPKAPTIHHVEVGLPISQSAIEHLDQRRHAHRTGSVEVYLKLGGQLAWLRWTGNDMQQRLEGRGKAKQEILPDSEGLYSEVLPFWTQRIDTMRLEIDPLTWVEGLLPHFGLERSRFIEVPFGPALTPSFNRARQALDARRYLEAIQHCRPVIHAWEGDLGAGRAHPVAAVLGDKERWAPADPRKACLDHLWKALHALTDAAHHPEEGMTFTHSDAQLAVLLTAVTSNYLRSHEV